MCYADESTCTVPIVPVLNLKAIAKPWFWIFLIHQITQQASRLVTVFLTIIWQETVLEHLFQAAWFQLEGGYNMTEWTTK